MTRHRFAVCTAWTWPLGALLLGGCQSREAAAPTAQQPAPRPLAVAASARPLALVDESAVAAGAIGESPARATRRLDLYEPLAEVARPTSPPQTAPAVRQKPAAPRDLFDALADLEAAGGPLAEPARLPDARDAAPPSSDESDLATQLRIVGPDLALPDPPDPPQPLATAPARPQTPTSRPLPARPQPPALPAPQAAPPPVVESPEPPPAELVLIPPSEPEAEVPLALQPQDTLPAGPAPRNPEMEAVLAQASEHVRAAFDLARRHAVFSARAECLAALRLLAQAHDAGEQTDRHTRALAAGLVALEESQDFVARPTDFRREIDLAYLVAGHRTTVLKTDHTDVTPLVAAQRYYTFAQEQLVLAAGNGQVGSAALYALGRLTPDLVDARADKLVRMAQSMVFYQAAMLADAGNYRAANELGVLLAKGGRLEAARGLFERALTVAPQPVAWHNLAVVNKQLGDERKAAVAFAQAAKQGGDVRPDRPAVQWVDAATFAQSTPPSEGLVNPPTAQAVESRVVAPRTAAQSKPAEASKKGSTAWLPWNKGPTK